MSLLRSVLGLDVKREYAFFFEHPIHGNVYIIADNYNSAILSEYGTVLYEGVYKGKRHVVAATGYRGMLTYRGHRYEEIARRLEEA